ncbi:MAG: DUF1566 domain-containing protein [Epsilonproteobacteria bacterium]|nr:DUF1566 domain-containing protein [Campylobacterota bacterium]
MERYFLILIVFVINLNAEFSRSTVGVVTDSATNLEWQDDYSSDGGVVKDAIWIEAIDYCENLSLDGGGWRLPNIQELGSIVRFSHYKPAIDPIFHYTQSDQYWSATSSVDSTRSSWSIDFLDGRHSNFDSKDHNYYVRCVRSRQPE